MRLAQGHHKQFFLTFSRVSRSVRCIVSIDKRLIVLFGPTLAAMCTCVLLLERNSQRLQALQRSLFRQWGNGVDLTFPQPRFQAVGLAIDKRETWRCACI